MEHLAVGQFVTGVDDVHKGRGDVQSFGDDQVAKVLVVLSEETNYQLRSKVLTHVNHFGRKFLKNCKISKYVQRFFKVW